MFVVKGFFKIVLEFRRQNTEVRSHEDLTHGQRPGLYTPDAGATGLGLVGTIGSRRVFQLIPGSHPTGRDKL